MSYMPSDKTLRKYGLSEGEYYAILDSQGGVCAVCKKVPNGRFCIDHDHVKGFKKLPPEKRKLRIRGVLCWFCNHWYLGRAINVTKARNVLAYLQAHEDRLVAYALAGDLESSTPRPAANLEMVPRKDKGAA